MVSEMWTLDVDSDDYQEIRSIMDEYLCHVTFGNVSKNNHATWVTIYNEAGLIFDYRGTDRVGILGVTYAVYGTAEDISNMMNAIRDILAS